MGDELMAPHTPGGRDIIHSESFRQLYLKLQFNQRCCIARQFEAADDDGLKALIAAPPTRHRLPRHDRRGGMVEGPLGLL
jgi:hypothetical protein